MKIIDINYFNNSTLPFNFESKFIYLYMLCKQAKEIRKYENDLYI